MKASLTTCCSWPLVLREHVHSTHLKAKEVEIELILWKILNGEAMDMLSHVPYNDCAFPQASKLTLQLRSVDRDNLLPGWYGYLDPHVACDNVCAFVRRIRQMAPSAKTIGVCVCVTEKLPGYARLFMPHFGGIVTQLLLQLVNRVEYDSFFHDGTDRAAYERHPQSRTHQIRG